MGSGGSAHRTLISAFVPFSTKNVTGRDIMKGNEDEFGILRNASASQMVSFSTNQGATAWGDGPFAYREKEGVCRLTYMKKKIQSGLEGIDRQHLPMADVGPSLPHSLLENLTCFNLRVTRCIGSEGHWGWGR